MKSIPGVLAFTALVWLLFTASTLAETIRCSPKVLPPHLIHAFNDGMRQLHENGRFDQLSREALHSP